MAKRPSSHTSGASLFSDQSRDEFKRDKFYSDDKTEEIDALSDSAPHRQIDFAVTEARQRLSSTYTEIAIMTPR
ncbi:uncharacterized protein Z518_08047 [Rhinocladiella mackenziei CBS 650.93]|uniref:Uncharacterized protein n=1 Tax=Rhinocladiella mackenziei CBS 650.93 TaxID=1442369 RepID=A0A0D2GV10_9EURO|nr:uncharacterized protein Z518_08047 [Rhinocladiella mackenziei CBS 650.93]KIX02108.1 hypothetical protein Z518_08047 [Rhinocladiella mackenziei CBS 650.93]